MAEQAAVSRGVVPLAMNGSRNLGGNDNRQDEQDEHKPPPELHPLSHWPQYIASERTFRGY